MGYTTIASTFNGIRAETRYFVPLGETLEVWTATLTNSIAHGWQPMGAHQVKLTLQPGESRTVTFVLGYHENPQDDKFDPPGSQTINKRTVTPIIARYLQPDQVEAAFTALRVYWDEMLGIFQVRTPDEHVDRMVNIWNAYQCMVTFNMSRSTSLYESGIGRGMGFRDSNQDLLGFVHRVPGRARERILDIAATQLPDGGAYHQYQPLTMRGNNDVGGNFNDDPLWLILGVAAYLKESGDWDILEAPVSYDNAPGSETPLYEHLQRSLQYTLDRLGPHGLPLIGRADWNDCLNLNCFSDTPGQSFQTTTNKEGKVAESVFIAGLFVLAADELADIAAACGLAAEATRYRGEAAFEYYYRRINPSAREAISEVHRCGPYVYAQMIAGRDAATHGEAKNSWLSGTAAWNYVAITRWLLGIRPTLHGLQVAPVLPADWPGFTATRRFQGVMYTIEVVRRGFGPGVALEVDGVPFPGDVVPRPAAGVTAVTVRASLGG